MEEFVGVFLDLLHSLQLHQQSCMSVDVDWAAPSSKHFLDFPQILWSPIPLKLVRQGSGMEGSCVLIRGPGAPCLGVRGCGPGCPDRLAGGLPGTAGQEPSAVGPLPTSEMAQTWEAFVPCLAQV